MPSKMTGEHNAGYQSSRVDTYETCKKKLDTKKQLLALTFYYPPL